MSIKEPRYNKKNLRLNKDGSYWFDIIFGFIRFSTILIVIVHFILNENLNLIKNCLTHLNWHYNKKSKHIELTSNTYLLKFVNPSIFEEDNYIFFNFKYHSAKGRISFFFGISSFLKWKFIFGIKKILNDNLISK